MRHLVSIFPNNNFDEQNMQLAVRLHTVLLHAIGERIGACAGAVHRRACTVNATPPCSSKAAICRTSTRPGRSRTRNFDRSSRKPSRMPPLKRKCHLPSSIFHLRLSSLPAGPDLSDHIWSSVCCRWQKGVVIDDLSTGSLEKSARGQIASAPARDPIKIFRVRRTAKAGAKAEFIFHLARPSGSSWCEIRVERLESSFHETQILLRAAAARRTPLLLTSTSEVYGKSRKPAFGEDDDLLIGPPGQSRWSYACSKLTDEFLALAYAREKSLPVIIARLFNTVGPRQTGRYGMVLPRFIAAAKKDQPLKVFGDGAQTRCFCHVSDAVEALVRLQHCPKARGEIFNVGGTEEFPF